MSYETIARRRLLSLLAVVVALGVSVPLLVSLGPARWQGFIGELGILAEERPEAAAGSTVFLVRHAEALYPPPEEAPHDPPLNRLGRERAELLARVLRDAGITGVLSTDLHRTRQTAGPLVDLLGLEVETYDHRALAALAERLSSRPGVYLVSGHSNTTPEMVRLLGGDPGPPIDEKTEFDRLYVLSLAPERPVSTLLLHYGDPPGSWPPTDPAALAEP